MEANLSAILGTLAAHHVPVLLTGMEAPPNLGASYAAQFRDVFAHLSHRPGLIYDPFFLQGVAANPQLNQADGIHPNAEGVSRVVARITPLVEQLIAQKK
jgi:acyl-CoA thioesterase-1